jgi:hypothetical protein
MWLFRRMGPSIHPFNEYLLIVVVVYQYYYCVSDTVLGMGVKWETRKILCPLGKAVIK